MIASSPFQILFIEDDPLYVELTKTEISTFGCDTTHASTKAEALAFLSNIKFDLIVLDLHLPDGNNFALFQEISDMCAKVPIVILSAVDEFIKKYLALGADFYIPKAHMMLCLPLYIRQKMLMKQHVDVSVQKEEAPKDQVLDYIEKLNAKINKITKKAELATTARRNGVSHVD